MFSYSFQISFLLHWKSECVRNVYWKKKKIEDQTKREKSIYILSSTHLLIIIIIMEYPLHFLFIISYLDFFFILSYKGCLFFVEGLEKVCIGVIIEKHLYIHTIDR